MIIKLTTSTLESDCSIGEPNPPVLPPPPLLSYADCPPPLQNEISSMEYKISAIYEQLHIIVHKKCSLHF